MENEENEKAKEKKKISPKALFWTRFAFYILFMCIIPVVFLVIRFRLFQKISAIQIGGWGIVCILILAFSMVSLIKQAKKGLPFCYLTHVLNDIIKVVFPLAVTAAILYLLQDNVNALLQGLYILIPCEFVAALINPLPRWAYDNKLLEGGYKLDVILKAAGLKKDEAINKNDKTEDNKKQ